MNIAIRVTLIMFLALLGLGNGGALLAQGCGQCQAQKPFPIMLLVKRELIATKSPSPNYLSSLFGPEVVIQAAEGAGRAVVYQIPKDKYDRHYATSTMGRLEGGQITEDHLFPDAAKSRPLYLGRQAEKWCQKYPEDFCLQAYYVHDPALNGALFTPEGLTIVSGPYCDGPFEQCAKVITISAEEMIKLGAASVFWEKPKPQGPAGP